MEGLTLYTVLITALVDSINPCAIGVLILLCSALFALSHNPRRMLAAGLIYVFVVFLTYFSAGIGLLYFLHIFKLAKPVGVAVGILVVILGFVELKDFFWYGKGFSLSIPARYAEKIKTMSAKATVPGIILLGFLVAAVELPCTGGPYLAITTFLAQNPLSWQAIYLLLIYNFIFVLPLLVILGIAYFSQNIESLKSAKDRYKRWMRLFMGVVMVTLGILLIAYARGDIII